MTMNKLTQIQNFYGNSDFNNWIANCKPFKPTLNLNDMYIQIKEIPISDALIEHIRLQQEAFKDILYYKWI